MIEQKRVSPRGVQATPGAVMVLGGLLMLLVALAVYVVRNLAESGEGAFASVSAWLEEREATEPTAPVPSESGPTDTIGPDAAVMPATPERDDTIGGALDHCLPALARFAQNVRLIAIDASTSNVDFVQEWGTPGEFVRIGCEWDGLETSVHEAGSMVVPPMVGKVTAMPPQLLQVATLSPEWFAARMQAAAGELEGLVEVQRVEVSWLAGAGVLTRVRVLHNSEPRDVVLDGNDRMQGAGARFPQVQRMTEMTAEAAQRGYRDLGQTNWSVGVLDSLEQMRNLHFPRGQRLLSLQFSRTSVLALVPAVRAGGPRMLVVIDHYGERQESEDRGDVPNACSKPFTFAQSRAALDTALRARRQTLAQFEAIDFELATIDCAAAGERPAWHFTGG